MSDYLFTSESVSEGHPDKVSDQVSDAVLDALLAQDPKSRVAAETLCTTGLVLLAGEITSSGKVDYIQIVRDTLKRIGYDNTEYGIDYKGCSVQVCYGQQSADIAQGVDKAEDNNLDQGAGDQGLMFGYACDETSVLMPAAIHYAHRLVERQAQVRRDGRLNWLRPDAKSQITLRYVDGKPHSIDTVVLSTQHSPDVEQSRLKEAVIEEVIKPVLPKELIKGEIKYLINPTGRFVVGGPQGDCGLTGARSSSTPTAAPLLTEGELFGQGSLQGRPFGSLCRPLCRQEHRRRGPRHQVPGAGQLRHRCRQAYLGVRHHAGHRQDLGRGSVRTRRGAFRPSTQRHRPDARPAPTDLRQDGRVWPFRPRRTRVQLGTHGSRGSAEGRAGL
jgi:hypothetical protein